MKFPPSENGSASSSCSWAVINEESSQEETTPKVCSVCGLEIKHIYFNRPSCEVCVLCESCQGLDLSGFPGCNHNSSKDPRYSKCDEGSPNAIHFDQPRMTSEQLPTESSRPDRPSREDLSLSDKEDSSLCRNIEPLMSVQVPSDQTALTVENRSIRIGQGTRSLTEHIMEALQQSTPQIGIPDSFSSMVPPTLPNTSQRLRYSPPIMSFPNYGTSVSRSNSPSPVSFAGNNDISTSSSPSPSQHGTRKSSLPESPILGPVSSSERSAENGAMGFLKSVVLHSTAALNNFDLMPLGSLDQMKYDAVKKDSNIISPSVEEVRIHEAQNPVTTKVWDDEKLRALIKPKSVPKVVSEVTAYNLR